MIYPFLVVIIIELAIDLYFHFKNLPGETQKEMLRKVDPVKGEIIEWQPLEDEIVKTSRELTEELIKK